MSTRTSTSGCTALRTSPFAAAKLLGLLLVIPDLYSGYGSVLLWLYSKGGCSSSSEGSFARLHARNPPAATIPIAATA